MDILRGEFGKRFHATRAGEVMVSLLLTLLALLAVSPHASAGSVALGAYVPRGDENPEVVSSFGNEVGWSPLIVNSFKTFDQAPIYYPQLNGIHDEGAVPMITWEPQTSSEGRIGLNRIAAGAYDGYIGSAARDAAAWGKPLMVRFGQEMNGSWYPWSPASGNSAHSYVHAWRHVVKLFRREGADNVKWVWTPYVSTDGDLPLAAFYPGDAYVDWAGVDGYNWGGSFQWKSFHELFARSYHQLLGITSRPLMIGEVGCGEGGGNKAAWIRQMLRHDIPRMGHVRAVLWFDDTDEKGDLRVDTSGAALSSLKRWSALPFYTSTRKLLLRTPERLSPAAR
ncbi:MAG TPA: glycosyl hydrolase [Solirubrobacterales bacterium]|nr:glycosyl hydrolase [Solirubrobacterales bacterium]